MVKIDPSALYPISELPKILRKDRRTVRRWVRRAGIEPYTKFVMGSQIPTIAGVR